MKHKGTVMLETERLILRQHRTKAVVQKHTEYDIIRV